MTTSVSIKELGELYDRGAFYYHGLHPEMFTDLETVHDIIRHAEWIAVDTETIGLGADERQMLGIGIAITPEDSFYWVAYSPDISFVKEIMEDENILKVFHNTPFDSEVLIDFHPSIIAYPCGDSMQLCQQEGLPKALKEVAKLFKWDIDEIIDVLPLFGKTMLDVPEDITAAKCCWDIRATHVLWTILRKSPNYHHPTVMRDASTFRALAKAHHRGMALDQEVVINNRLKYQETKDALYTTFRDISMWEFNPGASEQVAFVLSDRGHFMKPNWEKKQRMKASVGSGLRKITMKTGEDYLLDLYNIKPDPFILGILNYRDVAKRLNTYIDPFIGLDRTYTRFHIGAETQRMSSYMPNSANVPSWARPQWIFDGNEGGTRFDKNQQELRILANFSGDGVMLGIFEDYDATGMLDNSLKFHSQTATLVGSSYDDAKTGNFCMVYGGSAATIANSLGCTIEVADNFRDRWAQAYPIAFRWIEEQKERGREEGIVHTIIGRPMVLPVPGDYNKVRGEIDEGYRDRCAVNWPIQASGAEDTKGAINELDRYGADIRIPIHDEVVLNGQPDLSAFGLEETIPGIRTPIDIDRIPVWMKV